jgi:antitoxin component of MazEF toxin-antitoxin module
MDWKRLCGSNDKMDFRRDENMSRRTTIIDDAASISLPPEAVDALGVEAGSELDVEIVGHALVVRSVEEAQRSRDFINAFDLVLKRRLEAYKELAEGPTR